MQFKVLTAVLAVVKSVSLEAEPHEKSVFDEFPKGTDAILDFLDEEVGDLHWKPPQEYDTFEHDLNNLLGDFYDKVGDEWGSGAYGSFYEHGGYSDVDHDYGLDPHGVPVYNHQHFDYNGQYGNPWAEEWEPHYIHVNYPEEQAYSYQVEPTIQWTRVEHHIPPEYQKPVPNFDHVDHEGYFNEWEDFYIEDYLGSPGHDHSHFDYETDVEFHNHHLLDPYAIERRFQPPADEYFIPVVVDPIPTAIYPEVEIIVEETGPDYVVPLDLDYYLADDYYHIDKPYVEYEKPVYVEPEPYVPSKPYYAPHYDDLSFLFEHQPYVPPIKSHKLPYYPTKTGRLYQAPAYKEPSYSAPIYHEPHHGPSYHAPAYETIHGECYDCYEPEPCYDCSPTVDEYLMDPYLY